MLRLQPRGASGNAPAKRRWRPLAEERIRDVTPAISLGQCF
jgi:hypothetical protein